MNNVVKKIYLILLVILSVLAVGIVLFSSIVYLYDTKDKITDKFLSIADYGLNKKYSMTDADEYWAKEILNGGYILHFRHAERDKWLDVQMYDVLESDLHKNGTDNSRYAENDYFSQAVCLNDRGKIQARAMGEHISNIGLPISQVVTSVSCRARQTADLAFGGFDSQHRLLVHTGPYNENTDARIDIIKKFYSSLPASSEGNVIVSAHNGVVKKEIFENANFNLSLDEGGFYVISQRDGKLYLEHEFHNFRFFTRVFYAR